MKRSLRVATGVLAASVGLLAFAVPSGATVRSHTFVIDAIMHNDLNLKAPQATNLVMGGSSFDAPLVTAADAQWNKDNGKTGFAAYNTQNSGWGRSNAVCGPASGVAACSAGAQIGFSDFPLNQFGNVDVGAGAPTTPAGNPAASLAPTSFVQVPVALGGVAIVVHFGNANTFPALSHYGLTLNGKVLGEIFKGTITNWDDHRIEALNPHIAANLSAMNGGTGLPIQYGSRTAGSGTTAIFSDYLSQVDAADFPAPTSAAFAGAAQTLKTSALLDNWGQTVPGSIIYVEFGYAEANHEFTAKLVNRSGVATSISAGTINAAASAGLVYISKHGGFSTSTPTRFEINNEVGKTVYPIAGFSYGIIFKKQVNKSAAIASVKFLDFLSHRGGGTGARSNTFGQDLAIDNGYAPLPTSVSLIARSLLLKVKVGATVVLTAKD
jgi:phosphate transport system substrate-binding protein